MCEAAAEAIENGDEVEVNFDEGTITNLTKGETYQAEPFPAFIQEIIAAGGLLPEAIENGDEVEVNFDEGTITNLTKGETYQAEPFPAFIQEIIAAGGLLPSLRRNA